MGKQQQPTQRQDSERQDPLHQGTEQVGTHGSEAWRQTQDLTDNDTREKRQGDRTDPAMPQGTTPLERDQRPINQQR